jgi:hypothetical protein
LTSTGIHIDPAFEVLANRPGDLPTRPPIANSATAPEQPDRSRARGYGRESSPFTWSGQEWRKASPSRARSRAPGALPGHRPLEQPFDPTDGPVGSIPAGRSLDGRPSGPVGRTPGPGCGRAVRPAVPTPGGNCFARWWAGHARPGRGRDATPHNADEFRITLGLVPHARPPRGP